MNSSESASNGHTQALMPPTPFVIRLASPKDAWQMLDIYGPVVLNTAISFEVETPTEEEFRRRITANPPAPSMARVLVSKPSCGLRLRCALPKQGRLSVVSGNFRLCGRGVQRSGRCVGPLHFAARGTAHPWLLQRLRWNFPSQPRQREPSRADGLQACRSLSLRWVQAGPVARRRLLAVDVAGARRRAVSPQAS